MIGAALAAVCKQLNTFLREQQGDSRDVVVLSPMANPDGSFPPDTSNRVIFTLANVLEETALRNQVGPRGQPNSTLPFPVNLHVGFVANFTDYQTGLGFISDIISYLQYVRVFNHENTPDLDPRIDRLYFSMLNLEYSELSYFWGMLGASYRPSVLYEIRMLSISLDPRSVPPR